MARAMKDPSCNKLELSFKSKTEIEMLKLNIY